MRSPMLPSHSAAALVDELLQDSSYNGCQQFGASARQVAPVPIQQYIADNCGAHTPRARVIGEVNVETTRSFNYLATRNVEV